MRNWRQNLHHSKHTLGKLREQLYDLMADGPVSDQIWKDIFSLEMKLSELEQSIANEITRQREAL